MASRPVWKGSIQFSLVAVPVRAYTASISGGTGIAFNQLHKDCHSRIKYQKVCPLHGEVRSDEIVSGYEFSDGQYVVVDPQEIETLRPAKDKAVRIAGFLKSEAIDPRYYSGKTYYLVPEGAGANKPYVLLQRVLLSQKRIAFAQVVISGREQLVLLRPLSNLIAMSFLTYATELKPPAEFTDEVPGVEVSNKELDLAKTLTEALEMTDFDLSEYRDNYAENVRKLIDAKIEGREVVAGTEDEAPAPLTINLMEALQKSLGKSKNAAGKKPPKLAAPSAKVGTKSDVRRRKTSSVVGYVMPMSSSPLRITPSLPDLIRGSAVAYTGRLARICHEEFVELVERHGGRPVDAVEGSPSLVVIGEHDAMLAADGTPAIATTSGSPRLISEREFLEALGAGERAHHYPRLYSAPSLCELLGVNPHRLRAWMRAGLITPLLVQHGVGYFDFRQVATAKNLSEAARSGVKLAEIRKGLERLRTWMPDTDRALEQLSVVEQAGPMLIRLEDGELADTSGQFHFDFTGEQEPAASMLMPGIASTAADWFEQGVQRERDGQLAAAEEAYRQALLMGGPEVQACYNLANVLHALGKVPQATERYRQAVEIDPGFADAWNNLGLVLCQQGQRDEACYAFRQAIGADPEHAQAHYNVADTLDELGRWHESLPHWRAYARFDPLSLWGQYARGRLA